MIAVSRRLDEVCAITMGQAPSGDSYNARGDGVPLIAGAGDFDEERPQVKKYTTAPSKICAVGDIVLGIRASIGTRVWADSEYCLGRGVAGLRPGPELHDRYLWHWLAQSASVLAAKGRGATFLQVNRRDISEMEIHLPPLPEQRRIAAILDQADTVRVKRRQALAHLDDLTQSIFHKMFDAQDCGATVGEVAEIQGGLQVSAKRASLPMEVPYLRVANVHRGRLVMSEVKTMRATPAEIERTTMFAGDLLFVEGHANPNEVGRVAMWTGEVAACIHQNHLIRARLDPSRVLPIFATTWLNSDAGARHFRQAGHTTSGLNTISAATVRSAPIPVPPMDQQREYAGLVGIVDTHRTAARRAFEVGDELFVALQARAFRGEL